MWVRLVGLGLLAGCGAADPVVGFWRSDFEGGFETLEVFADGTGINLLKADGSKGFGTDAEFEVEWNHVGGSEYDIDFRCVFFVLTILDGDPVSQCDEDTPVIEWTCVLSADQAELVCAPDSDQPVVYARER
ncbi:MAG: hypothetical protein KTR31_33205 [Myxococcales bacterium]|nr:hypothetical protein [Myxococcales bacterium]